jgi:hypothetical protein
VNGDVPSFGFTRFRYDPLLPVFDTFLTPLWYAMEQVELGETRGGWKERKYRCYAAEERFYVSALHKKGGVNELVR